MASTRLSLGLRDKIVGDLLEATFKTRCEELKARSTNLAEQIYLLSVPEGFLTAIKPLPKEWFRHVECLRVRERLAGGGTRSLDFQYETRMAECRPFPAGGERVPHLDEMPLALERDGEAYRTARHETRARLVALVGQFKTLEKLREAAPELTDYLPKGKPEQTALPIVQTGATLADLIKLGLTIPKE